MALFESYERRIDKINAVLNSYGISSIEEAEKITKDAGLDDTIRLRRSSPSVLKMLAGLHCRRCNRNQERLQKGI